MPDTSHDLMGGIGLCPSPPHRCVLGLVRAATGGPVDASLRADLRASNPDDIVRIAVNAYVHVVLASGFAQVPDLADAVPRDLVILFKELQAANLRRNEAIRAQLGAVGGALAQSGVRGVALKGAAELLAPVFPDPAFRFLSDVDILVPETDLDHAVASLHAIGAVSENGDRMDYRQHHHEAPLYRPDWPVPVELHRQLYAVRRGRGTGLADTMRETARPSGVPGLDVPAPPHRLAHAVFHAQVPSSRYRTHELSLRDALEFELLSRSLPAADVAAAKTLFSETSGTPAWEALDASRRLVFGGEPEIGALPAAARHWAEKAVTLFGRPGRRSLATSAWLLRGYVEDFVFEPRRRRSFLRQLARRGGLRTFITSSREKSRRNR